MKWKELGAYIHGAIIHGSQDVRYINFPYFLVASPIVAEFELYNALFLSTFTN